MIEQIGRILQLLVSAVALAAGLFTVSPAMTFLLIVSAIPVALGESHGAFLLYALNFVQTPLRRQLLYIMHLGTWRESAKEVKLFDLSPFLGHRFGELSKQLHDEECKIHRQKLWLTTALSSLAILGQFAIYAFVLWKAIRGTISIGTLTFVTGVVTSVSLRLQEMFILLSAIADGSLYLTDLIDFFALKPKIRSKPGALPAPRPFRQGFEFRNVSFQYPASPRKLLIDVNFHLAPGERIALVGENGNGKTTIVKLLMRFLDPTDGQILLDGRDLREYSLEDLRRQVGAVFQDFVRYNLTAADNIAVSQIEHRTDRRRLELAAEKSLAAGVISQLPHKYETMLGTHVNGVDLSGGEWQQLALSRVYFRDAQLLVLDEPTSALDPFAEEAVFQRFSDLSKERTVLIVSHRFSTVRMANRILVLHDGRITESGDHDQLMALGHRYAKMFELQARRYQ